MAYLVGLGLAMAAGLLGSLTGMDRERAFYPTIMIVIALLYVLYAVIGGSAEALKLELLLAVGFIAAAVAGFRYSLWLVVAALIAHGVYDLVHNKLFVNPGTPPWWPDFCSAYDVVAGLYLAWLLKAGRVPAGRNQAATRSS